MLFSPLCNRKLPTVLILLNKSISSVDSSPHFLFSFFSFAKIWLKIHQRSFYLSLVFMRGMGEKGERREGKKRVDVSLSLPFPSEKNLI